jgi:hypothetical protein
MMKTKMILVAAILLMSSSAFAANVLLITRGNSADDNFTTDVLINQGSHVVTIADIDSGFPSGADGKYNAGDTLDEAQLIGLLNANDVVVIGESVSSGDVAPAGDLLFGSAGKPIVNNEPYCEDDWGIAVSQSTPDTDTVTILDDTSPLAAGYSGAVAVLTTVDDLAGSVPGESAGVVGAAVIVNGLEADVTPVLWYYTPGVDIPFTQDTGDMGTDKTVVPFTYVHFMLHSDADGQDGDVESGDDFITTQAMADMLLAAVDFAIDNTTAVDDWMTLE